jgi:hypothetical protein
MFLLKQCPRCSGDLVTGSDQYGEYVSCMQCGFCKDVLNQEPVSNLANSLMIALTSDETFSLEGLQAVNNPDSTGRVLDAVSV